MAITYTDSTTPSHIKTKKKLMLYLADNIIYASLFQIQRDSHLTKNYDITRNVTV